MADLYEFKDHRKPKARASRSYSAAVAYMHKRDEQRALEKQFQRAKTEVLDDLRWELTKGFHLLGKLELELHISNIIEELGRVP